jgi:hypothetical protein
MRNATAQHPKSEPVLPITCQVTDDLRDRLHCTLWLDEHGHINESEGAVEEMFGYWLDELKAQHISMLLPEFTEAELLTHDRINPLILFRSHCSVPFLGLTRNGLQQKYQVFLNFLSNGTENSLRMIIRNCVY